MSIIAYAKTAGSIPGFNRFPLRRRSDRSVSCGRGKKALCGLNEVRQRSAEARSLRYATGSIFILFDFREKQKTTSRCRNNAKQREAFLLPIRQDPLNRSAGTSLCASGTFSACLSQCLASAAELPNTSSSCDYPDTHLRTKFRDGCNPSLCLFF